MFDEESNYDLLAGALTNPKRPEETPDRKYCSLPGHWFEKFPTYVLRLLLLLESLAREFKSLVAERMSMDPDIDGLDEIDDLGLELDRVIDSHFFIKRALLFTTEDKDFQIDKLTDREVNRMLEESIPNLTLMEGLLGTLNDQVEEADGTDVSETETDEFDSKYSIDFPANKTVH